MSAIRCQEVEFMESMVIEGWEEIFPQPSENRQVEKVWHGTMGEPEEVVANRTDGIQGKYISSEIPRGRVHRRHGCGVGR